MSSAGKRSRRSRGALAMNASGAAYFVPLWCMTGDPDETVDARAAMQACLDAAGKLYRSARRRARGDAQAERLARIAGLLESSARALRGAVEDLDDCVRVDTIIERELAREGERPRDQELRDFAEIVDRAARKFSKWPSHQTASHLFFNELVEAFPSARPMLLGENGTMRSWPVPEWFASLFGQYPERLALSGVCGRLLVKLGLFDTPRVDERRREPWDAAIARATKKVDQARRRLRSSSTKMVE